MEIAVALLGIAVLILVSIIASCAKDECKLKNEIDELNEKLQSSNSRITELAVRLDNSERCGSELRDTLNAEFIVCDEIIKERDKLKEDLVNAETKYEQMKLLRSNELRECRLVVNDRDFLKSQLAAARKDVVTLQEKLTRVESALKPPASVNDAVKPVYWNLPQDFKDITFASIFGRAYANT